MVVPGCPRCGRELMAFEVLRRGSLWGGGGPRPRSGESWWECPGCDWLGVRRPPDGPLRPMRRLEGAEETCVFCGFEGNVAGVPWRAEDGGWRDWIVCLSCGRSNQRRVGPPDGPARADE
ncbi:hypothetical protein ACGFXC_25435 [Streptomyces sp. NPDC048507]|uniref:hypothetical protein n=1 Tax=Streptomyces sp. NPDC048507 TaxID=3365560 RepID=UPI003712AF2B